jgi:hypothetical protein
MDHEKEYVGILITLAKATGELTARQDILGIRFLIECCDAILGHALQVLGETERTIEQGKVN